MFSPIVVIDYNGLALREPAAIYLHRTSGKESGDWTCTTAPAGAPAVARPWPPWD